MKVYLKFEKEKWKERWKVNTKTQVNSLLNEIKYVLVVFIPLVYDTAATKLLSFELPFPFLVGLRAQVEPNKLQPKWQKPTLNIKAVNKLNFRVLKVYEKHVDILF